MADIKQKFVITVDGAGKVKAYTEDLKNNEDQTEKNEKANKGLSKSLKGLAAAFVSIKTAKLVAELGELGARAVTVEKSFQKFAKDGGRDAQKMLADLRKASGGLSDDMFLQQQAMKAMISGMNFDDVVTSLEFVRKFSIATGEDMNQKFQTVMTGLARGSADFLDDVGIQVQGSKDVVNDAIAQMEEKMSQFADTSEDSSTKISLMKAEFQNLRQEIGVELAPVFGELAGYAVEFMHAISDSGVIERFRDYMTDVSTVTGFLVEKWKEYMGVTERELPKTVEQLRQQLEISQDQMSADREALANLKQRLAEAKSEADAYGRTEKRKRAIMGYERSISSQQEIINRRSKELISLTDQILDLEEAKAKALETQNKKRTKAVEITDKQLKDERKKMQSHFAYMVGLAEGIAVLDPSFLAFEEPEPLRLSFTGGAEDDEMLDNTNEFMAKYGKIIADGLAVTSQYFTDAYSRQMQELNMVTKNEIEAVKASTKSEKQKAKEIEKINKDAAEEAKKIRLKEWGVQVGMSIANTALAVTKSLPNVPLAAAVGVIGAAQTGVILANKPRYYYGSRDASGNYKEVGGNSTGDTITAQVRSGEAVVPMTAENRARLNGNFGVTNKQTITVGAPSIVIQGNVDGQSMESLNTFGDEFAERVARVIEQQSSTNIRNRAF